jgi:hypothetical protein
LGYNISDSLIIPTILNVTNIQNIFACESHSLLLDNNGFVLSFGSNGVLLL